ncbi:MAG: hypothetical protein RSC44_04280 [Clostridia bacterium]
MKKTIIGAILSVVACTALGASSSEIKNCKTEIFAQSNAVNVATATIPVFASQRDIYAIINPNIINFYETNIAKEKILSNLSPQKLQRMAEQLEISVAKLNAVILLHDLVCRQGGNLDLKAAASMTDIEMFKTAKTYIMSFIETLSDAEKADLDAKFQQLKKQR